MHMKGLFNEVQSCDECRSQLEIVLKKFVQQQKTIQKLTERNKEWKPG